MNMIETQHLKKTFQQRKDSVEAVKDITLQVRAGEIFGFLGPNGAGKTTTLRMLTTLIPPTDGHARVAGFDLLKESGQVRRHIGYVSQAGGTDSTATGRENLMLQAQLYELSRREAEQRTRELLAALEMDSFADRTAKTYSGGQKRRLDLALGMVHRPK
ncbi:MAG: ATP-binding cassette domain-containing protein, partial [Anaerolineae bacterium]|nr:ATP-binding cassette domain-containing protein [Anaerolineae bacterium]